VEPEPEVIERKTGELGEDALLFSAAAVRARVEAAARMPPPARATSNAILATTFIGTPTTPMSFTTQSMTSAPSLYPLEVALGSSAKRPEIFGGILAGLIIGVAAFGIQWMRDHGAVVGGAFDRATTTEAAAAAPTDHPTPAQLASEASLGPFRRDVAVAAVTAAAADAPKCRKPEGPFGAASIAITFAPDGTVSDATVDGPPFVGTPVGTCLANTMRKARIEPFSGVATTIHESVSLF
jgi:hypothetical protein